jgi:hypothetical protein
MQEIWSLLLDDSFVKAYTHGILIPCGDGVKRRIFPRIFTYAADYPEKWVFAYVLGLNAYMNYEGYFSRALNTSLDALALAV